MAGRVGSSPNRRFQRAANRAHVTRIGVADHGVVAAAAGAVFGHQVALAPLAAHASHGLLYVLMIAMPLAGWAMCSAGGYPVMLSDSLRLPPIFPVSPVAFAILRHLHTWLAMLLFVRFLAHMAAALYHGLIRRDGVFASMTLRRHHRDRDQAQAGPVESR